MSLTLAKLGLKKITLNDYDDYYHYVKKSSYFTGLWASTFTYIWVYSQEKHQTVYLKVIDHMLVPFVITHGGYMYIWSLPIGEGDATHVLSVLYKGFKLCRKWNQHHKIRRSPFLVLINQLQLEFLQTSPYFTQYFHYEKRKGLERIWSVQKLIELKGKDFRKIREAINKFRRVYPHAIIREYRPTDYDKAILLKKKWNEISGEKYQYIHDDHIYKQILQNYQPLHEYILVAEINKEIVGIITGEILPNDISWGCLCKTIKDYNGLSELLYHEYAKLIHHLNPTVTLLNGGSDNDHPGLRSFKEKFNPVLSLEKYTVHPK